MVSPQESPIKVDDWGNDYTKCSIKRGLLDAYKRLMWNGDEGGVWDIIRHQKWRKNNVSTKSGCCSSLQYSPWTAASRGCGPRSSAAIVFRIVSLSSGFVRKSTMFSALGIYLKLTSFASARSLTKWWRTFMCFVHRWFLSFVLRAIAPLLSACMVTGHVMGSPISSKYLSSYNAWVVAWEKAINSASTVDKATMSCFFVFQETGPPATTKILPSVERLVFLHPAKSESTYPTRSSVAPAQYLIA